MVESRSMPTCPMANMCRSMTEKRASGHMLWLMGVVFIVLGVVVLVEPAVLAWLAAIALIAMGIGMLAFGRFVRRSGHNWQHMHG